MVTREHEIEISPSRIVGGGGLTDQNSDFRGEEETRNGGAPIENDSSEKRGVENGIKAKNAAQSSSSGGPAVLWG